MDQPRKLMRKPRVCDATGCSAPWPGLGVGCPGRMAEAPASLRSVYLWHCGAPACEADCTARFADQLRKLGRFDLADKLQPPARRAAAPKPSTETRPADPAQGNLI